MWTIPEISISLSSKGVWNNWQYHVIDMIRAEVDVVLTFEDRIRSIPQVSSAQYRQSIKYFVAHLSMGSLWWKSPVPAVSPELISKVSLFPASTTTLVGQSSMSTE